MMIRFWQIIIGLSLCGLFLFGCQPKAKVEERKIPQTYICHQSIGKVKIDGILDEKDWQKAEPINFYHLRRKDPQDYREPESPTIGKLLWDKDYFYVSFKAYDKDIWGYYTERDETTYREDVLEIFLKPDAQKASYYNFEINALGTVYDAFNFKRGFAGGSHRWSKWNCEGLKIGIKVKGSLNNWKDEDECWVLEVAIPFSAFKEITLSPKIGDEWSFALCRYDYSVYLEEGRELSSSAKLSKLNFHLWEDYDRLLFSKLR
ncbi:MAG: carbohydrate-binding family 9-like protein [Candidatus Omnitrophica bacterium]|nr:carbohydrate-binding family 9-like protein [Candidatus Omnitrophota bacterium]